MKKLFLLIALTTIITAQAQESLRFGINQDARLAVLGDERGNDAFTPALLFRFDMQGNQQKYGYMSVGIELEYADLKDIETTLNEESYTIENNYKRYSVNVGYTLNKLIIDKLETTAMINCGMIDRWGGLSFLSFSASGTISYPVYKNLRVQGIGQFTQRKDKEWAYGDDATYTLNFLKADFSFLVGITYDLKL